MKERRVLTLLCVALLSVILLLGVQASVGADPDPAAPQLLLTEICVTPTAGEFVEIYNPTGAPVDLSNVYFTDATYAGGDTYYYNIVTGVNAGGDYSSDFHVRFPDGATIGAGEYQTIAMPGSDAFFTTYGITPTYELREDGGAPDAIPDMREALTGSIGGSAGLSNDGEVVILYYWDGQTDLVTDLDYVLWGDKYEAVDKTGVSIDGPDAEAITSTYLADTAIASQDIVGTGGNPHAGGNSAQRQDFGEGAEVKTGGNGADGHDETSEDLSNTWSERAPTPNAGWTMLLLSEIVVTPTGGEFVEIYNPTGAPVDLSNVYFTDATYAGGDTYYYNIVTGVNAGGDYSSDFHVRFPDGASIDPGEYQTISMPGSDSFFATYGIDPTYELREDGGAPDAIPDMREALTGSIGGSAGLSNDGEVVILYYWNGQTDLVTDLDYVVWGDKAEAVDKTGVSIDGPDADVITSTYLADTAIASQDIVGTGGSPHAGGNSAQRQDMTEGAEAKIGGNGADGHDETSEDLSNTWAEYAPTPNGGLLMLMLSEIVVTPTEGEFVEIYNPTGGPVDLSDVYFTDATYAGGDTYYYNIVTGVNAGGDYSSDFHVRFPDGATIDPGAYQTIALAGSDDFFAEYGIDPTYELFEDGGVPDAILDMRTAFTDSIGSSAGLSNSGEVVILYYWNGQTDLVTDLDYFVWGDKAEAVDKTGVSIDGPDADVITSTYLADTAIASQDIAGSGAEPHAFGNSAQRQDLDEGAEIKSGGNGAQGHDETSEDLSNTWGEDTPTPGEGIGPVDQPSIVSTNPASDALDANPYFPVKATFDMEMMASSINATNFTLEDGSGPVIGTVFYDSSHVMAIFEPDVPLAVGVLHTATVKAAVAGSGGTPMGSDYVWSFTTAAVTFSAYHGSLHNHTSYSDGTADPATAFAAGKARGLDFMSITDHSHSIDDAEWEDTLAQAIAESVTGSFIAFRGAEYTQGSEGHLNVYNTTRHPVRSDTTATCTSCDYTPSLSSFYDWMALHPEAEGQFNHPGWMNFNDWEYRADADPTVQMLEVGNGAYSYYIWTEEEYRKALDYGWRVGPTNNGDTHSDEWGIDNPGRSGIWATELTYNGVMEAMDAMRIFATEDGNFELSLKGDGAWMGETIPNDGTIDFEIYVYDPDGESLVSLELYTDQGQVVASTVPPTNPYNWNFAQGISEGVHYFFVRAEQADGDRTVSAPIWTAGDVDVSPTRLDITPAQLSTLAPANFSARVTNRGIADATNVNVTFKVGITVIGTKVITVPTGSDAFASIGWMPDVTGLVDISVEISSVPAGDNPDDNTLTEQRNIVDYAVPLIVIDNGHSNAVFESGDGSDFKDDLVAHGFNWIEDTDGITAPDLATAVLLVISDPGERGEDVYTTAEEQTIADFVNDGGALLITGDSDYNDHGNPEEINAILDKITGSRIRMNSDGTHDDTNNGGAGPWHVLWHVFPGLSETGIGANVDIVVGYSGASIYGIDAVGDPVALVTGGGVTITVEGDDDTYQLDGDGLGDYFDYTGGVPEPMAAVQALPTGGRIAVWGDSAESFSNSYTYVPGDGFQNEIYNMQSIYWLLGRPLELLTVAEARADAGWDDTPDRMDDLVWVEGTVTADYGNFYDVLYVQDGTGGVTVYAPVGGLAAGLTLGAEVRVVGRVELYQGDTEVQIDWDPEQVQIIGAGDVPVPLVLSTYDAALEQNEGWLVQTSGSVVSVINDYSFVVDDGSGPCRVFIDGYNGSFAGTEVSDSVQVIGLASEDGDGQRIRVRKPDDVSAVNTPPTLGAVVPPSGTSYAGDPVVFMTSWADADGWEDLKKCYFHIGGPSIVGSVTLMYNRPKNRLWLRSDDGTAWTGGFALGSANVLENSQAAVDCSLTFLHGSGDTLAVAWTITFKPAYVGSHKTYLKALDMQKARAKAKKMGTWTLE